MTSGCGARAEASRTSGTGSDRGMPPGPVKALFEDALMALWQGKIEDDGFNALVLDAHLTWQQVVVLRAYAKYLRQAGIAFSQRYIERVLALNVPITRLLVRLFESRFDPARDQGEAERSEAIAEEIRGQLDEVAILDHDRILRSYLGLILATLRTYFFQHDPSAGAGGAGRAALPGGQARRRPDAGTARAPAAVRAVRLLAAAGGGAPAVRPGGPGRAALVGPAGGLPHRDPRPGQGTGGQELGHRPVRGQGRVRLQAPARPGRPRGVPGRGARLLPDLHPGDAGRDRQPAVRPGGAAARGGQARRDDPYLVVAADKGTATFSDTANEIAQAYGYWLGDAFASGGSEGYDHKKMGITARGAWESVKFHFADAGLDPAATDFTVAGIGDMSGDVFGNGMLLSEHIKLVAAFDHRHIFLDPDAGRRGQLRRAAAAVRAAPLLLGGL